MMQSFAFVGDFPYFNESDGEENYSTLSAEGNSDFVSDLPGIRQVHIGSDSKAEQQRINGCSEAVKLEDGTELILLSEPSDVMKLLGDSDPTIYGEPRHERHYKYSDGHKRLPKELRKRSYKKRDKCHKYRKTSSSSSLKKQKYYKS